MPRGKLPARRLPGDGLERKRKRVSADLGKKLEDLRIRPDRVAIGVAQTDPGIALNHKFDWDHVLAGEFKAAGRATGHHSEPAAAAGARMHQHGQVKQYEVTEAFNAGQTAGLAGTGFRATSLSGIDMQFHSDGKDLRTTFHPLDR